MNPLSNLKALLAAASLGLSFLAPWNSFSQEPAGEISGPELAARLDAARQSGSAYIRLKMDVKGRGGVVQLQVKERHSGGGGEAIYQVLWPKERQGEAVLLRRAGRGMSGFVLKPGAAPQPLSAGQMNDPFFGSDLAYEDLMDNFFGWPSQTVVGNEVVDRVNCVVLESKPGKGSSSYGYVRSWVDPRRFVPLRVEKYSTGGKLLRRIDTTRVTSAPGNRTIPSNLTIRGLGGGITEIDGNRIKHNVAFADRDFTPEALADVSTPKGAPAE